MKIDPFVFCKIIPQYFTTPAPALQALSTGVLPFLCRFVKHIGQRTGRGSAGGAGGWGRRCIDAAGRQAAFGNRGKRRIYVRRRNTRCPCGDSLQFLTEYAKLYFGFVIRLQNYSSHFAYLYFRTTYFQYLVEIFKKGLGNNTNIFPNVLREFPIPDISLDEQQRIVDEITAEIRTQEQIHTQISELRKQIDRIITEAITA